MKFSILIADNITDGSVGYEGRVICDIDLINENFLDQRIWAIQYDDTVVPPVNDIEYQPSIGDPEEKNLPTSLTEEQVQSYGEWARTKVDAAFAKEEAAKELHKYHNDYGQFSRWEFWDASDEPRIKRDELLAISDPYITVPSLDANGWESWRQWVRNLPSLFPTPLDIEWVDPPANASTYLKYKIREMKTTIDDMRSKRDSYVGYVPPVID